MFKIGDKVRALKSSVCSDGSYKIGEIYTILSIYEYGERITTIDSNGIQNGWGVQNFELVTKEKEVDNKLKAGQLFKKNDTIYLVADSSNQRWIVDIITGESKWLFKAKEGTVSEVETKGYKYLMTTKEMLNGKELKNNVETPKALPGHVEIPDSAPKEYSPFSLFDLMLKSKLGY